MRKRFLIGLAMALLPAFAWAADRDALLRQATELGRQGHAADGLAIVGRVLNAAPSDGEARLMEARLLAWAGRNSDAEAAIGRFLADYPTNSEALALAGSIAWYRGDAALARSRFEAALAADAANDEARQGLERIADAAPRNWRLDTGLELTSYDGGGRKDWQDGFLRLGHSLPGGTTIHLLTQHSHRFGEIDRFLEGGVEHPFTPWLRGRIAMGATPAADFLPRHRLDAGGSARVAENGGILAATWLTADLRHAAYRSGDVKFLAPGLQQYLSDGRAWATGRFFMMEDERGKHPTGWEARADWQALDRLRLFAGYADVPETSDNQTLPTTSRFLGAVVGLTETVDFTLAASRVAQEGIPRRGSVAATLGVRF